MREGLPPEVDSSTRILVIGTFPGEESLAAGQYYANTRNRFWRVMDGVLGLRQEIADLPYQERLAALSRYDHIGLWDKYRAADRKGSLDASIRGALPNPIVEFVAAHGRIVRIVSNGKRAVLDDQDVRRLRGIGVTAVYAPSTSPANAAFSLDRLVKEWRVALGIGK